MVSELIGNYCEFLEKMDSRAMAMGLMIRDYEIDHICYRCATNSEYINLRSSLAQYCSLLLESMIGGRPISVFEFNEPLRYNGWTIRCLELASPKNGRSHHPGLEHAEVVIGTELDGFIDTRPLLEAFVARCSGDIAFDYKAANKEVNADVSVDLGDNICLKFHSRPLYQVCRYELDHGHVELVPSGYFD